MKYVGVETIVTDKIGGSKSEQVNPPILSIIVPCYNEEEVFNSCFQELESVILNLIAKNLIALNSYILFVDDGSKDKTWSLIKERSEANSHVKGLKLSRNRGHQVALLAGLSESQSDVSISIDADLQDDVNVIEQMIVKFLNGSDIVYGVRNDRASDTLFKRKTAGLFYGTMKWFGVEQIPHHADFRLLSDRAKQSLLAFKEQNLYLRGLVPLLGFKRDEVFYSRAERLAGESKYPLRKMLSLALEGITSLTVTPLRIIAVLGFIISAISIVAAIYAITQRILGHTVEGWTSVIIAITFLGGVQMLSLGIIGEYVGKIYVESKNRPKYFIEEESGK